MKNSEPVCSFRSLYNNIGLLLLIICFVGCTSGLYVPVNSDADRGSVSLETLNKGRDLYVRNCGGCHNLKLPSIYTRTEWKIKVDKMKTRAKIDDLQAQEIYQYLKLAAKKE